jgi:hypothetical protein
MKKKCTTVFKSIFLLACAVPVYAFAYVAMLLYWEFSVPSGSEFLSLYLPTAIFISILVSINYLSIKWIVEKIAFIPGVLASVFFSVLAFYAIWFALLPSSNDYRQCDFYTRQMKGGVHVFRGVPYVIELCGLNGFIQPENFPDDEVRLRVLSMDNELLAERFFSPLLAMGEPVTPLKYEDDSLAYRMKDQGPERRVRMPPSRLDWLRSRLPRLWP